MNANGRRFSTPGFLRVLRGSDGHAGGAGKSEVARTGNEQEGTLRVI